MKKKIDPSKPLVNGRYEFFAQKVAGGMVADEAYALAGYKAHAGLGSRLKMRVQVRERIAWLRGGEGASKEAEREDPAEPLWNERHEVFAQEVAKGTPPQEVCRRLGYAAGRNIVHLLRGRADVRARVGWLQEQAAGEAVLTLVEKRRFLRRVVETGIGVVGADDPICQALVRTRRVRKRAGKEEAEGEWETERIRLPDKLRAIALDNALAGEEGEGKVKVKPLSPMAELMAKIREERRID